MFYFQDSISENSILYNALKFPKHELMAGHLSSLFPKMKWNRFATYPIGVLVKSESRFDLRSFI